ncbi:MAG: sugar ABC transporter permease [Lachnospiraceae bacterium]|nr:sugar ABC transporter permease [Lachnospiraceae bacterium]
MRMEEKLKKIKTKKIAKIVWKHRDYYLMLLPAVIYVIIFCYVPMYGLQIAFKNYRISLGFSGSKWVGLKHFRDFFNGYSFVPLLKNTLFLSLYQLVVSFPFPIIVALIINELKGKYKKIVQTVLYAPHFISTVVLVGMIAIMFSVSSGVVNTVLSELGFEKIYFMGSPKYFRHLYVWSGIWQQMGWNAVIYISALSGVDPGLHEAASIDGASRMQRIIHINIPSIIPTIMITLILAIGSLLSVGYEKAYLLQTELNVSASEIISTYVYKRGIVNSNFSFSTAVGLFNNVINVTLLILANKISNKFAKTSLF